MRSGKGGSASWPASGPSTGVGRNVARRDSGYAPARRPSKSHVRPVTGLALAHLRNLRGPASNRARKSALCHPGTKALWCRTPGFLPPGEDLFVNRMFSDIRFDGGPTPDSLPGAAA